MMRIAALVLLALAGLALAAGGAWLLIHGGSVYYLLAGLVLLVTAALLRRRSGWALSFYASFLFATLAWAIGEVGFDVWALAPRGGLFVVIGLLMLASWPRQNPERLGPRRSAWRAGGIYLALALAVCALAAVYAILQDPQSIGGEAAVPQSDRYAYGRTEGGGRTGDVAAGGHGSTGTRSGGYVVALAQGE